MASPTTPLLAGDRRPSAASSDRLADDEDDLLTGISRSTSHPGRRPWYLRLRESLVFLWALLATVGVIILAVWTSHNSQTSHATPSGKRNLIFMVSDGMGPASLSLTRSFRAHVEGLDIEDEAYPLTLDKHFWGSSRTRSSSSLVTDSAAGATAFSCGKKSYNGAISMLPDYTPCGTVLEAAKKAGYMTGLVVTTDITDATPATFASHVHLREEEDSIAMQEVGFGPLGRVVDLMFGGGRCHFLPNGTQGSCRADDVDVAKLAQEEHGWTYIDKRAQFDEYWEGNKDVPLPILGLFASHDIPFELDRQNQSDVYPSLSEMARTALRALEKATENSDKGFFLLIEGSRIDHAGHANDPAAQVREVLEYDKTFAAVLDFLEETKSEGVVVGTSDHETGGLSVARQNQIEYPEYLWYPEVLKKATSSSIYVAHRLHVHIAENPDESHDGLISYINQTLTVEHLGITDATSDELKLLALYPIAAQPLFAKMVSVRAQIGWSTHGHSAVDVNIYSSGGPGTDKIRGNIENVQVGKFLREYLNVDVEAITQELNDKGEWKEKKLAVMDRVNAAGFSVELNTNQMTEEDHWMRREDELLGA